MATSNFDAVSATTGTFTTVAVTTVNATNVNVGGNGIKVTTVTATANDTLDVAGLAVGDVVLGINATSNGAVGHPGAVSAGAIACTQVADSNEYVVVWVDAT